MIHNPKAYPVNNNSNNNNLDSQRQCLLPRYEEVTSPYTYRSLPTNEPILVIRTCSNRSQIQSNGIISRCLRSLNVCLIYISFIMVVVISVLLWTDFPNTVANEIANGLKVEISEVHITGMSLSTGIEVQVLSELNMNYGGVVSSCAHTLISKGAGLLNTVNLRPSTIKLYFPNDNGEYDKKKDSDMASTAREDIYVAQADIPFTVLNIGDHTTTKLSFTTKIHNFRNPKTMSKMAYMLINNESFEVLGQMDLIIAKGWLRTGHINLAITEIVNPSGGVFNSTMLEYTKSSYHNFGHALSSLNDFSIKENSEL